MARRVTSSLTHLLLACLSLAFLLLDPHLTHANHMQRAEPASRIIESVEADVTDVQSRLRPASFVNQATVRLTATVPIQEGVRRGQILGPGITCPSDCTELYTVGQQVTLEARPSAGWALQTWQGACTGPNSRCVVTMDAAKSVTAIFTRVNAGFDLIHVGLAGNGSVTGNNINCPPTCDAWYSITAYRDVTLTATPQPNWLFEGWSGNACIVSGDRCTIRLSSIGGTTHNVQARFRAMGIDITVDGNGRVTSSPGSINCPGTCSQDYANGTAVRLTAQPASGWRFTGWSPTCGSSNPCTVTVTGRHQLRANFAPIPQATLTVTVDGSGQVSGSLVEGGPAVIACPTDCTETLPNGTQLSLNAVPQSGWRFAGWTSGNCTASGISCRVTLDGNTTVAARFTEAGDINRDGRVDITDLSLLLAAWEQRGCPNAADLNGDCVVNSTDLSILLSQWDG
jgi:hypothetical protein